MTDDDGIRLSDAERRRRRSRSVAIAVLLAVLAVIFYAITVVRLGPAVFERGL